MTSHIWMFIFFLGVGAFAFGSPLLISIPEQKETYLTVFQLATFICTALSGWNAFDDIKKLLEN